MLGIQKKGQIVEIPSNFKGYALPQLDFNSKKEELIWYSKSPIYTLFDGILVGEHSDINQFIIGQRKKINIGGKNEPLYVIYIDKKENRLYVGKGKNHPGLYKKVVNVKCDSIKWINFDFKNIHEKITVIIESSYFTTKANLYRFEDSCFIEFEKQILSGLINNQKIILNFENKNIAELYPIQL